MNEQLRMAIPVLWPSMAIAGAVLLMAWWPRKTKLEEPKPSRSKGWAGALAFGMAFAASFAIVVGGMPKLPPPEKWQWLLPMLGIATGFGVLAGLVERAVIVRLIIGMLSAACIGLNFHPIATITQPVMMQIIVGVAIALLWLCMESTSRAHRGLTTPLLMCMVFAGVSIVILQGRNANISLLAASVSAALGVTCAIALLFPPLTLAGGATHVLSGLLVTILATAWMYAIGEKSSLILLAAAPLLLRIVEFFTAKLTGWRCFLVRVAATVVPVGVAVGIAVMMAAKDDVNTYGM